MSNITLSGYTSIYKNAISVPMSVNPSSLTLVTRSTPNILPNGNKLIFTKGSYIKNYQNSVIVTITNSQPHQSNPVIKIKSIMVKGAPKINTSGIAFNKSIFSKWKQTCLVTKSNAVTQLTDTIVEFADIKKGGINSISVQIVSGKQCSIQIGDGTITGLFVVDYLPSSLNFDSGTGIISGIPFLCGSSISTVTLPDGKTQVKINFNIIPTSTFSGI